MYEHIYIYIFLVYLLIKKCTLLLCQSWKTCKRYIRLDICGAVRRVYNAIVIRMPNSSFICWQTERFMVIYMSELC